jgi:hypothetical protein
VLLFRPPYEGRTTAIDSEVRALGMLEVLWNVDSGDSLGANYAGIRRNVTAGLRPGSIVLMHENRGQTIRALPIIFAALARRHLRGHCARVDRRGSAVDLAAPRGRTRMQRLPDEWHRR